MVPSLVSTPPEQVVGDPVKSIFPSKFILILSGSSRITFPFSRLIFPKSTFVFGKTVTFVKAIISSLLS